MSETKFTPGPWSAGWSKYRERSFVVRAGMPTNRVMASFDGDEDKGGPDDMCIANAHLIAAAPDLYAALAAVFAGYPSLEAHIDDNVRVVGFVMTAGIMRQAYAALSKARGEAA